MPINVGVLGFAHGHVNAYCTQWTQNSDYAINLTAGWDDRPGAPGEERGGVRRQTL